MSREVRLYIEDMRDCARRVSRYAVGVEFESFVADEEKRDAIVRNLELIGEAAKHVPESVRTRFRAIEWRKMAGLRDVLIHSYFGLEPETLWDIVQQEVPPLLERLDQILADEGTSAFLDMQ